jgi:DNA repair exonuclease SbcCD ATPase subunit
MKLNLLCCLWAVGAVITTGCDTAYYKTMERFGRHKRDIMVDRVADARDAQNDAKEQFVSALEQFSSVVNFEGGDLEARYNRLNREYDRSQARAETVRERIRAVKKVSEDLFSEWEDELDEYASASLRRSSEQTLRQTRRRYQQMIGAMEQAESKIDPVLRAFGDQVLFLKHNLNARAVASLQDELVSVESEIAALVREMERSIDEANAFIQAMTQPAD